MADGRGSNIAAQTLFSASSAANAIPVAGQFASAGLAIAGLFTKIFAGRRQAKKKREQQEGQRMKDAAKAAAQTQVQPSQSGGVGTGTGQSMAPTAPPVQSSTPAFTTYGGGAAPPVQQTLNNQYGFQQ